jgi:hypothetical protein
MKKTFFAAAFTGILMCGGLFAQTPSADPSAPQAQPSTSSPAPPQQQMAPPTNQNAPSAQAPASPATGGQPPTSASPAQASGTPKIAPGSVIPVQLTKSIDAKKVKTGDQVVAKVTQDLKTSSGEVLVPKDTKILGHVTEAQARTKEQKESQLGIAFDHAVMKNGSDVQLPMSIQAIVGQQNNNPNAAGGSDQQPAASPSAPSTGGGSARPGMAGSSAAPSAPPSEAGAAPSDAGSAKNASPQINGQTQGVVGIPNMSLAPGANATQGSVVTSDKNNVKLESGTMLLLKVNQ